MIRCGSSICVLDRQSMLHQWSMSQVSYNMCWYPPIAFVDCDPPIKTWPLIGQIWRLLCVSMFMPLILGFSLFSLVFWLPIVIFFHCKGSCDVIVLIFEWSLSKFWRLIECFGFIFGPFANKDNTSSFWGWKPPCEVSRTIEQCLSYETKIKSIS